MRENKILWYVVLAAVCWALYASMFDTSGGFDPTTEFDVVEYRIGYRLGMAVERTDRAITDQNRAMQGAVHHRERRVNRKVEEQTGDEQ